MNLEPIKLTDKYTFYPELLSVLSNDIREQIPKTLIEEAIKSQSEKIIKNTLSTVSYNLNIISTGYCSGSCQYCYANNIKNIDYYLSLNKFKDFIDKYQFDLSKGYIVFFGGEPLFNLDKFKELFNYIIKHHPQKVTVISGMMFDNDKFNEVKRIFSENENLYILTSMDPPYCQRRRYGNLTDEQIYQFVMNRFKELYKIDSKRVELRTTLGTDTYYPWIESIEKELGNHFVFSFGWEDSYSGDPQKIINEFRKYNEKRLKEDPQYTYYLFNRFIKKNSFVGVFKRCHEFGLEFSVNYDGDRVICCRDCKDGYYEGSDLREEIFGLNYDSCKDCELSHFCLNRCVRIHNKSHCELQYLFFIEWMKLQAKRNIQKLLDMSLIKEITNE